MASFIRSLIGIRHLLFIPGFVVLALIAAAIIDGVFSQTILAHFILLAGIGVGSWQLLRDTYRSLLNKSFALDYIAILAIITGVATGNFFVAGVIVLMMAGGNTLEIYAQEKARRSLTSLSNRIPHQVVLVDSNKNHHNVSIAQVDVGSIILVRKGEVIPLDGELLETTGVFDESSLTGEAFPVTKEAGDLLRSGVVNTGEAITLKTTVSDKDSTYRRIIKLVEEAQNEKPPFLQLADALSGWFTVVALLLAGIAYFVSGDFNRVLAVLVIATPCPLILAAPIALIGGMNAAARERIIFKRLAALEILSRVKTMIFDKTGTITFGIPTLSQLEKKTDDYTSKELLGLAAGLERNSLHPFAKAVLHAAKEATISPVHFTNVQEKIGVGLQGEHQHHIFTVTKNPRNPETVVLKRDKQAIAHLHFTDELKPASASILRRLQESGLNLYLFTGDTAERAQQMLASLPAGITVKADCSPEDKRTGVAALKKRGQLTAMVGDGINDAPALALADVGLVFSHEEHTAASEAADVILLGGTFPGVLKAVHLSRHTLFIAKQSMYLGLGLSLLGMVAATLGYLPPLWGALSQEVIDVAVIMNALRAAVHYKKSV